MIDPVQRSFPFRASLSLKLLIEYWEKAIESGKVPYGQLLLDAIRRAPELKEPVVDLRTLEKHRELVDYLMSAALARSSGGTARR